MGQRIVVGSDNNIRVVESGPIGPEGPAGPRGLPGLDADAVSGLRKGLGVVTPVTETVGGIDYEVLTFGSTNKEIYVAVLAGLSSGQKYLVRIDSTRVSGIEQPFILHVAGPPDDSLFYVDMPSVGPVDVSSQVWSGYDGAGQIQMQMRCMPGSFVGGPDDVWFAIPLATQEPRLGVSFLSSVSEVGDGVSAPDCSAAVVNQLSNYAVITIDVTGKKFLEIKTDPNVQSSAFKPYRLELVGTDLLTKIRYTPSMSWSDDFDPDLLGLRHGSKISAMVQCVKPDGGSIHMSLEPVVIVSPRFADYTSRYHDLGTITADTDLSCLNKHTDLSFSDGANETISFVDLKAGEYTELWLRVYNGRAGGGGTIAPIFGSAGEPRVDDIPVGMAREFAVTVYNDGSSIHHTWNNGRTIASDSPDF